MISFLHGWLRWTFLNLKSLTLKCLAFERRMSSENAIRIFGKRTSPRWRPMLWSDKRPQCNTYNIFSDITSSLHVSMSLKFKRSPLPIDGRQQDNIMLIPFELQRHRNFAQSICLTTTRSEFLCVTLDSGLSPLFCLSYFELHLRVGHPVQVWKVGGANLMASPTGLNVTLQTWLWSQNFHGGAAV